MQPLQPLQPGASIAASRRFVAQNWRRLIAAPAPPALREQGDFNVRHATVAGLSCLSCVCYSRFLSRPSKSVRLLRTRATAVTSAATIEEEVEEDVASSRRPRLRLDKDDAGNLQKLMVTTPLFYANGSPHIGSAYPAIAADVMARYGKLREAEVHYVTGMDEHGEKIARTAAGQDKTPQELVDGIATEFQDLWDLLKVQPDHFARTTPAKHKEIVHEMWQRCLDNGDIYKKDYSGFYCVGCEAYLDEDEMSEGHICKIHQKECEWRSEENYFFRLSKYWGAVRQHLEENPDFILPTSRRSQVLVWLEEDNKRDFSISRASTSWGIPVPGDDSQVIYVWFDALLGYLSSLLGPEDPATLDTVLQRGWPADVHVIGKDIMRFHAIYWPAMLMSAGLPLPKHICTHGFLTKDGLKMGKSLGNVVGPIPLVNDFGSDAVRFFFSSCLSFGLDGDFSYETFIKRVNSNLDQLGTSSAQMCTCHVSKQHILCLKRLRAECRACSILACQGSLANELGNLVHRILTLLRKNLADPASPLDLVDDRAVFDDHPVRTAAEKAPEAVAACYEQTDIPKAVAAALEIATVANVRMNEVEPWAKLKKNTSDEEKSLALRELLVMAEGVRICAVLLSPVTPGLSAKILAEFGLGQGQLSWKDTAWRWDVIPGSVGPKPTPVFQRIDLEAWQGK